VHATAILEGDVRLADDVRVGPFCVVRGPVEVGAGTRLLGNSYLQGPLRMAGENTVYPFVCIGFAPQSLGYDPGSAGPGVEIGSGNTFRESVTVHRAVTAEGPTRIGSDNYFMVNSHAGHDVRIGSHCVFGNGTLLGGHAQVGDGAVTGGNAAVHQFCRVGRGAMLSGAVAMSRDLPPFFMLTGINLVGSVNNVGMRRIGLTPDQISDVRWVYRTLYRRKCTPREMRAALQLRAERPIVAEYIEFLETSQRGLCGGRPDPRRPQSV